MSRVPIDHRTTPGPSRLVQFLRIAHAARPATWHRSESQPAPAAPLRAFWRIARGHSA